MATTGWLLLVVVIGILLDVGFVPIQANGADPYVDKYIKSVRQSREGFADFQKLLADGGIDVYDVIDGMRDNTKLAEFLFDKVSTIKDTGIIQENGDGERFYIFESEEPDRLVSETCLKDLFQYFSDVILGVEYASRMFLSWGKIPENAMYTGQLKDPGNIWLCQSTKANQTSQVPSFNGQYCYSIAYPVLGIGSCIPDTCSEADINALSWAISILIGIDPFYYVDCTEPTPWNTADIGFTTALAFFAFMVFLGSFYELYLQEFVLQRMRGREKDEQETKKTPQLELDNAHAEEKTKTEDQESDVATTSVDESSISEADDVVNDMVDEEKSGAKINEAYEYEDTKKPPPYQSIEKVESGETRTRPPSSKKKSNLGWALLHAIMMSFSAVNNCKKLLSAKKTKNTMGVLNGLRVVSMFWVILGHSCQFYTFGHILNPLEALGLTENLGFYAVVNATVSVDTFFVLSGFLVAYLTLKGIDSAKKRSTTQWAGFWSLFYFHRWWRLTPVYMAAMGIHALLMPHFGQGFGTDGAYDYTKSICRRQWWTHLIYINNLYPWPRSFEESCMGWAWYLANDMQFFIISPFILIILYKNGKAGLVLLMSIMLVSLSALFGINWYYGYTINTQPSYTDNNTDPPDTDTTYAKPYTRIPTYLVGMVVGYIIFKLKGKKLKIPHLMVIAGWLAALATLWVVLYAVWFPGQRTDVPQATSVMYLTFHRVAWGIGVGWIIFASLQGYGGPIGYILSLNIWIPLARLTYCAYLIHPVIIFSKIYSDSVLFHMSYMNLSYFFIANLVFSYAAALVLSLLIEGPTMGLEKVMFGKFKRS